MGKGDHKGEGNPANTTAYVQVLGVGADTGCTVPSVLLFFDRQRFLFNAGEGFQRFAVQHHVKLARVSGVLLTRVATEATGGLPGMLLSMADTSCGGLLAGHSALPLHGPPGLHTLVNAFRTFVNVRDIGLQVHQFGAGGSASASAGEAGTGAGAGAGSKLEPVVKNDLVTITPVLVTATPAAAEQQATGTAAAAEAEEGQEPEAKRPRLEGGGAGGAGPAFGVVDVPSVAVESPAACYVCELAPIPGKFQPQKAAALGVPRGPLYGKLVRGEEVVAANGRVVKPEEVMDPSTPGPIVAVVDCPSSAFLPQLVAAPALQELASGEAAARAACLVHLAPREVLRLPEYRAWMGRFTSSTTHILVAESIASGAPTLLAAARMQAQLNAVDSGFFPLVPARGRAAGGADLPPGGVVGRNLLRFVLRPLAKRGLDSAECQPPLDVAAVHAKLREERPGVLEAAAAAGLPCVAVAAGGAEAQQQETAADEEVVPECVKSGGRETVEVTLLGTGAAVPSKYRNVTGLHVNLFARGGLLMDCGEGSYSQLRRRFGAEGADDLVRALRCIWISHIHADHHVGLPSILAARSRLLGPDAPPLLVLGPRPLRRALLAYAQLEPMRFRYVEAAAAAAPPSGADGAPGESPYGPDAHAAIAEVREALGLTRFESVRVQHCAHAFGLVLEGGSCSGGEGSSGNAGWKVVFSGDTRPCGALIEAARGATLLIHEATFEDELEEEAVAKKHCTTRDAVEAGALSGAYRTLLTHFSQRYPKIPVIKEGLQSHVGIAFDLMSVNLADLPRLPRMVPALKLLFDEQPEDGADAEPVPTMLS